MNLTFLQTVGIIGMILSFVFTTDFLHVKQGMKKIFPDLKDKWYNSIVLLLFLFSVLLTVQQTHEGNKQSAQVDENAETFRSGVRKIAAQARIEYTLPTGTGPDFTAFENGFSFSSGNRKQLAITLVYKNLETPNIESVQSLDNIQLYSDYWNINEEGGTVVCTYSAQMSDPSNLLTKRLEDIKDIRGIAYTHTIPFAPPFSTEGRELFNRVFIKNVSIAFTINDQIELNYRYSFKNPRPVKYGDYLYIDTIFERDWTLEEISK